MQTVRSALAKRAIARRASSAGHRRIVVDLPQPELVAVRSLQTTNQPMPGTGIGSPAAAPEIRDSCRTVLDVLDIEVRAGATLPGSMFVIAPPCCSPRRVM